MAIPTASFNGYDLASTVTGLKIVATDPYRYPPRTLNSGQLAGRSKSILTSAYWKNKKINVTVEIGRNTRELFDESIDQLNAVLQAREKVLLLNYGSGTRKWTATHVNNAIQNVRGGHGTIDIEFECSDPMGYDTSSTTLVNTIRTGASSTENIIVGGTAEKQQPIITITLSALTGGSGKTISVGNPATGQEVSITRDWTALDVIIIDANAAVPVKVNNVAVDFDGAIPEWAPGAGTISYDDNLTTRTRTFNAIYYKQYL